MHKTVLYKYAFTSSLSLTKMMRNRTDADMPTVVVAMAVYNGENWLDQQLDSILKQRGVLVTIIISIDPSSDNSEHICNTYSKKYHNVYLLPNIGKFGNAANNFFRLVRDIDFSIYDYLSLADQDDIWELNKLIHAINCLHQTKCDGYSSNLKAFDLKKNKYG